MPRVTLRRGIFYSTIAATCTLVFITVNSPALSWLPPTGGRSNPSRLPPEHPRLLQLLDHVGDTGQLIDEKDTGDNEIDDSPLSPSKSDFVLSDLKSKEHPLNLPPLDFAIHERTVVKNTTMPPPDKKPWYFNDGLVRPTSPANTDDYQRKEKLWPDEDDGDRIVDQLMFKPPIPSDDDPPPKSLEGTTTLPYKKILMYNGMNSWNIKAGRGAFLKLKCPVDTCVLTGNRREAESADAIMFKDHFAKPQFKRPYSQVWIMYLLECPLHTQQFTAKDAFNWTATYRHDSDIVAPYEKYVYYDDNVKQRFQSIDYAQNKTKQVAWFVSNCAAKNERLKYAKELGKYINVDIYGSCGSKRCPRTTQNKCFEMLNDDYKFYLAFENSNCRDYITEKFFVNGLRGKQNQKVHNILPIVMGAHPDDYRRSAPYKSFIHVDDYESPKHLAQYLHFLDQNDYYYNEYFRWKGTGQFVNTYFMCRLCALLHDNTSTSRHYKDINAWWRGPGTCIAGSWRSNNMVMQATVGKRAH